MSGYIYTPDGNGEPVSNIYPLPTVSSGSSTLKGAIQNVGTSGTRVQLPNFPCREITIIAKKANTGSIYVGGSDVTASVYGVELKANESFMFVVNNANLIWIDASVSGEGVSYVAL